MKKLIVLSNLFLVLLSSCATQKSVTYTDDVYANPKEDRIEEARLAAIEKQRVEERNRRYNDSIALAKQAQQEKDDANPAYKDREFKYDDYYDYEYATRLKRFDNNVNGLSYYDNYYTNSYWYTRNPYNYGTSVYSGYSWWGSSYNNYSYNPSVSFYNSWGWGYGNQFSVYSGYNPYMAGYSAGYNNGFNTGMYGSYGYGYSPYGYSPYGYSPYGYDPYGYGNPYGYGGYGGYGYNNPYNNGWGYYNSYDNNSNYTYGPRTSHGGGNSGRTTNPGVNEESYSHRYVNAVADEQNRAVKFNEVRTNRDANPDRPVRVNANGTPIGENTNTPVRNNGNGNSTAPVREPVRGNNNNPVREPAYTTPVRNQGSNTNTPVENTPVREPVKQAPVRNNPDRPVRNNQQQTAPVFEAPTRNNTPSFPSTPSNGGGGGNVPSGGGGHRPR